MNKRIAVLILTLMLCLALALQVSAAQMSRLVDAADLLTANQEQEVLQRLDQVSQELQADLVIITLDSCEGYSPDMVIDSLYDEYGYGIGPDRDGVMLMLSMAERDYRILSNGFAADAITLREINEIGEKIVPELSDGDYRDAFMEFIDLCEYEINGERNGFPFNFGLSLGVSLAIGFSVALIVTGCMRYKLRSVRRQTRASAYTKADGLQLTHSADLFLYRTEERRYAPRERSSGSGSRGGGGGGRNIGGGKF